MDDSTISAPPVALDEAEDTQIFHAGSDTPETVASVGAGDRPIMSTPLADYTVTEGLLLCILLLLLARGIARLADKFFNF